MRSPKSAKKSDVSIQTVADRQEKGISSPRFSPIKDLRPNCIRLKNFQKRKDSHSRNVLISTIRVIQTKSEVKNKPTVEDFTKAINKNLATLSK